MFAFAIMDRDRKRYLFARDRIGKKPFHYYKDDQVFVYGSEIKSILVGLSRLGKPRPGPDHQAIVDYMGYGYVPDPETAFEGIRKLPPAHSIVLEASGAMEIAPYWNLDFTPDEDLSEDEHLDRMEQVLEEAVKIRMIADVPLGAYLSGGIDSSTVVGLMARASSRPVKTFSIGFEQQEFNELPHARRVAEHLGTEHHELIVRPEADALIDGIVRSFDEPFADSSAIPTYYVSKMAREHVTVVLSGDGGDELFAGYSRYQRASSGGPLAKLPRAMRSGLFGNVSKLLPMGFFAKSFLHDLSLDEDSRYIHHATVGLSEWHADLFRKDFAAGVGRTDPSPVMARYLAEKSQHDATTRRMYADIMTYLPADIMTKVDRMSMAVSLEARAPLLDHVFVRDRGEDPHPHEARRRRQQAPPATSRQTPRPRRSHRSQEAGLRHPRLPLVQRSLAGADRRTPPLRTHPRSWHPGTPLRREALDRAPQRTPRPESLHLGLDDAGTLVPPVPRRGGLRLS